MTYTYRIATLNINGLGSVNRGKMLDEFIRRHDIDIVMLQEVTNIESITIPGYQTIENIGTLGRGTAILHKENLQMHTIQKIPSGRGLAAYYKNICFINVYAPSGTSKRTEREEFFNIDIINIIPSTPTDIIMAGDFNCVQDKSDCTGHRYGSQALDKITQGLQLMDLWNVQTSRHVYTHYSPTGAARLDRIYATENIHKNKQGIETLAAAFTDHMAVLARIDLQVPFIHRGRGRWYMNTSLLDDPSYRGEIKKEWSEWIRHIHRYQSISHWWEHHVKRKIKYLFIREGTERKADRTNMENFYYAAIYDILQGTETHTRKLTKLKELKAKIVRLNNHSRQKMMLDTEEYDKTIGETPSLHHILKSRRRQSSRAVQEIRDKNDRIQSTSAAIIKVFEKHYKEKFKPKQIDVMKATQLLECELRRVPTEANEILEKQVTMGEIRDAIAKGKMHKAPGNDGIGLEFYKTKWETIKTELLKVLNSTYIDGTILESQLKGIIVCIPKHAQPTTVDDYRPITLLNADYKILTRIIAARLRQYLPDIIHPHQYCSIPGRTVFEAMAAVRDAIAQVEITRKPLCILSIDFSAAFDRISHEYLYMNLEAHGLSACFRQKIQQLYEKATSEIMINGFRTDKIPIRSSVRQGCPLSMMLYIMCLNPLIQSLERDLKGIKMGRRKAKTVVTAYADDVTIFLTSAEDIAKLKDLLERYEAATGAKINTKKSKAMALGSWDTAVNIMDIPYQNEIKILGIKFTTSVNATTVNTWTAITSQTRALAQTMYKRDLGLEQRIRFTHDYLLAKMWYATQIVPPTPNHVRQINSAIVWYIWKGSIFKVPLSTLQREKVDGGWGMINVEAKCKALFLHRMQTQCRREGSLTAEWMNYLQIDKYQANPPNPIGIPKSLEYVRNFVKETAYIPGQCKTETTRAYKRRIYVTLRAYAIAESPPQKMRVESKWPNENWQQIWENLTQTPASETDKAEWYKVIHDIIPTNERLHQIKLSSTALCGDCKKSDTTIHRLTECGEQQQNWIWMRSIIATMLRTHPTRIPREWLVRPHFKLWPPQRQKATLWLLARYVSFSMKRKQPQNPNDLMDFLRRSRWKMYQMPGRQRLVANFLTVLG